MSTAIKSCEPEVRVIDDMIAVDIAEIDVTARPFRHLLINPLGPGCLLRREFVEPIRLYPVAGIEPGLRTDEQRLHIALTRPAKRFEENFVLEIHGERRRERVPIAKLPVIRLGKGPRGWLEHARGERIGPSPEQFRMHRHAADRKSTRLNSSHGYISY